MSSPARKISKLWRRPMQVGSLLKIPYVAAERHLDRRLAELGYGDIRPAHYPVFQFLPAEGARLTELAQRANVTKQSMGELVAYLQRRGYLRRTPDPADQRAQLIRCTDKAWKVHDATERALDELEREWAAKMGKKKFDQLIARLGELATALGE